LIITENGLPDAADSHRPAFIVNHLYQLWRLHSERIPLLGYYFWSLLDNFEWTEGYDPRFKFGLFEVNFETQERKVRRSGLLYEAICKAGGLTQDVVDTFTPELFPQLFSA
jgi:beta-glucosidase